MTDAAGELDLSGEEGWTALDNLGWRAGQRSFVRADGGTDRLRIRYFLRESDRALMGRVWFGPGTQGPPGHAHGGSMASVLDDAMGISAWVSGHMVVAAEIKIRFKNMLPIGTIATVEALVANVDGKRVETRASLRGPDGTVHATGEGTFIQLGRERFDEMLDRLKKSGGGA